MMQSPHRLLAAIAFAAAFLLAGCTTAIRFPSGAPYQSPYNSTEGMIIAFPDELPERPLKIKVGGFLDREYYELSVGEAYINETTARLSNIFRGGITVTTHSVVDQLPGLNTGDGGEPAEGTSTSDLEDIIRELNEKERSGSGAKTRKSVDELTARALDLASRESIEQKNSTYLLRFSDALLGSREQRLLATFRVRLYDRRTGNLLLDKRYGGRSQRFEPVNSQKTNENRLMALTKQALSGGMAQMVEDIAKQADVQDYSK